MKSLSVALAVSIALSLTSVADAKQPKRQKHVKPVPAASSWGANGLAHQPAHMIQVGPGYWISSYGCVMDGGYGRLTPCDLTDHSD